MACLPGAGELVGQRIGGAHMNAVQREHQNRQQQKNQTGGEVQAQVIRTNHATFAPIEMTQHQNQREQYGERASATRMVTCAPAGMKVSMLPVFEPRKPRSAGRMAS